LSAFRFDFYWVVLGVFLIRPCVSAYAQAESPASHSVDAPAQKTEDQTSSYQLLPGQDPQNRLISPFVRHIVSDQKEFWTEPTRLRVKDLKWIAPFAGMTAAFIASDSWWSKQVPTSHVATSKTISDYGAYSFIGLGGASFLLGAMTHNDQLSETGLLAGEAAINATGVAYAFKEITQRQRPFQGNGNGDFFKGGGSFPSEHSAIAWSVASVWAHEYPGWLSQAGAYGLASAVTLTRVTAKQHFPSDVIIGSALGWYFGRQVYRAHHDSELGGSGWSNLTFDAMPEKKTRNPNYMASPYIPLDSWIYPELERLIALGYIKSPILGMRPWTRMQCALLLQEAQDAFADDGAYEGEAGKIYRSLMSEFGTELSRLDGEANVGARIDSIYSRSTGISGTPLRDGYHFGQTIINDYGRPYWTGYNNVTGIIADAETGPMSFFVRGEYQYAPAMPSYLSSVLTGIAAVDGTPPFANGTSAFSRFQLLDSMASFNINNLQISVGKQSEWWGPGESGALLLSNNAAPFPMVKIDDVQPHEIPGLSRLLGPMRAEFFVGQLSGQQWEECATCPSLYPGYPGVVGPGISLQPFMHGEKISFQPTSNLEFGMGVTAMFGGPGLPVTFGNFFHTYYIHTPNLAKNPGKRVSAADISYRLPGLRNWLTVYLDSMTWDEVSPIGSTRANVNPGIYMPKIPRIPKLDFRAEGVNVSRTRDFHNGIPNFGPGWVYTNGDRYRSGYTNDGYLLGSWIGRAGRGVQAWTTYWFSPRNKLQFGYRLQTVAQDFIGGGRLADYSAQSDFLLRSSIGLSTFVQYEQWRFPVLSSTRQTDITAMIQLSYSPKWRIFKK
jgi:membrane-associated phospholipid phosphatase